MDQDPLIPLNGAKLDFYCHFVPFAQNSGHTSGQIFFRLQKIFDLRSDSVVNSGTWTFWVYGSRPSDPSKWGKIGLLLPFCPLCPKIRSHKKGIFFPSSKNFWSQECFYSKIRCPIFLGLRIKTFMRLTWPWFCRRLYVQEIWRKPIASLDTWSIYNSGHLSY